jgi:hypothetical protein
MRLPSEEKESKKMLKQTAVIKGGSNIRVTQKSTNGTNCDEKPTTVIVRQAKERFILR